MLTKQYHPNSQEEWRKYLPITFQEVVAEIVQFTDLTQPEVEHRVWMQALEPGWNIIQDVKRFGVTPFQFNDNMARLYTEGDGFIFDSLVFWARPARQLWIKHALDRIKHYAKKTDRSLKDFRIFMHGDGPGNDSLFLASCGLTGDYYEVPDSHTYNFAAKRCQHYGFWESKIRPVDDYQLCLHGEYDAVISFEVLEHIPEPISAIHEI